MDDFEQFVINFNLPMFPRFSRSSDSTFSMNSGWFCSQFPAATDAERIERENNLSGFFGGREKKDETKYLEFISRGIYFLKCIQEDIYPSNAYPPDGRSTDSRKIFFLENKTHKNTKYKSHVHLFL